MCAHATRVLQDQSVGVVTLRVHVQAALSLLTEAQLEGMLGKFFRTDDLSYVEYLHQL